MCILLKSYKNYQKIICPLKKKQQKKNVFDSHNENSFRYSSIQGLKHCNWVQISLYFYSTSLPPLAPSSDGFSLSEARGYNNFSLSLLVSSPLGKRRYILHNSPSKNVTASYWLWMYYSGTNAILWLVRNPPLEQRENPYYLHGLKMQWFPRRKLGCYCQRCGAWVLGRSGRRKSKFLLECHKKESENGLYYQSENIIAEEIFLGP